MKTELNLFLSHEQENSFPSINHGVLENILVCVQISSKLANVT